MHLKEIYDKISETADRLSGQKEQTSHELTPEGWERALTYREVQVLTLVADGKSNKAIGEELGISSLTVKSHLARISEVMHVSRREVMVLLALRAGIIP